MERITQPDSNLRLFLNIGLYGLYIVTIMNILYFAELFYYSHDKDAKESRYSIINI